MEATIELIKTMLANYKGDGMTFGLFLCALLGALFYNRKTLPGLFLAVYSIVSLLFFFSPLNAYLFIKTNMGEIVYWRVLWIVPIVIMTAYTAALFFSEINISLGRKKAYAYCVGVAVVIIFCGKFIFSKENFTYPPNSFNVPNEVLSVVKIVKRYDGDYKIAPSPDLASYIRVLDPSVKMTYGRSGAVYTNDGVDNDGYWPSKGVYSYMIGETAIDSADKLEDFKQDLYNSRTNILVLSPNSPVYPFIGELNAKLLGKASPYEVYVINQT